MHFCCTEYRKLDVITNMFIAKYDRSFVFHLQTSYFFISWNNQKICCCLIGFYIFSTGLYLFSFIDTHGTCILSYLLCDTTCNVLVVTCMIQLVLSHLSYMLCRLHHISLIMMMHPATCHVSILIHAVQTQSHHSFK